MPPRIKICGLTRVEDLELAVQAGADALGLVFYPPSPRCVDLPTATCLARAAPPLVSVVGLFVNAAPAVVRATLAAVPIHLLQFHGDEDEAYCRQFDRPYIKAARVRPGIDLVQYAAAFPWRRPSCSTPSSTATAAVARFSTGRWYLGRWPRG